MENDPIETWAARNEDLSAAFSLPLGDYVICRIMGVTSRRRKMPRETQHDVTI